MEFGSFEIEFLKNIKALLALSFNTVVLKLCIVLILKGRRTIISFILILI